MLVPDQSVLASGGQTEGQLLHLAARHQGGKWVMVYLGDSTSFSVNMDKLSTVAIGVLDNTGVKPFATPVGWEDAVLVLEGSR